MSEIEIKLLDGGILRLFYEGDWSSSDGERGTFIRNDISGLYTIIGHSKIRALKEKDGVNFEYYLDGNMAYSLGTVYGKAEEKEYGFTILGNAILVDDNGAE